MTDLLTLTGRGQRAMSYRFDLLGPDNSYLGALDVLSESPASVTNNINRDVKRSMDGLTLPPSVTAQVNTLTERVKPWAVMEDRTEHPMGVFLFAEASRRLALYGSVQYAVLGDGYETDGTMLDQGVTLNQASRGINFYGPGQSVQAAIVQQLEAGGVIEYEVEPSSATISEWISWKPDEKRLRVINDLCRMGGYYSLYFDNTGRARARQVPTLDATDPSFTYDVGGTVFQDTIVETDDLLNAPNVYLVTNSGFTEAPAWGEWRVPSSAPNSIANRGFAVVSSHDVQGVESRAAARKAAKAIGQADYSTYRWVTLTAAVDPRHDTFDVIGWKGDKYRAQQWSHTLDAEDQAMRHEWRRVWAEDVADFLEEAA